MSGAPLSRTLHSKIVGRASCSAPVESDRVLWSVPQSQRPGGAPWKWHPLALVGAAPAWGEAACCPTAEAGGGPGFWLPPHAGGPPLSRPARYTGVLWPLSLGEHGGSSSWLLPGVSGDRGGALLKPLSSNPAEGCSVFCCLVVFVF